jgi:hypothetical protein
VASTIRHLKKRFSRRQEDFFAGVLCCAPEPVFSHIRHDGQHLRFHDRLDEIISQIHLLNNLVYKINYIIFVASID